jgi:hypothetical protein
MRIITAGSAAPARAAQKPLLAIQVRNVLRVQRRLRVIEHLPITLHKVRGQRERADRCGNHGNATPMGISVSMSAFSPLNCWRSSAERMREFGAGKFGSKAIGSSSLLPRSTFQERRFSFSIGLFCSM